MKSDQMGTGHNNPSPRELPLSNQARFSYIGWLMKRGLFLCGSGLLGAGAIVGLPMMLAPVVVGPVAPDATNLGAQPAAASPGAAASTVKRGAYFLSRNVERSTRNHE